MGTGDTGVRYYYNLKTRQVEKGMLTDAPHRMGPYDTEAEAMAAMERAGDRNEEWAIESILEAERNMDDYDRAERAWREKEKDDYDRADEAWKRGQG